VTECSSETTQNQDVVRSKGWESALPRAAYHNLERVTTGIPWFEVYRTPGNVFAIYEDGQFEETLSYLVPGEERAVLIDTGDGIGNIRTLAEELTSLPVSVVNTHHHIDHVAQNYLFDDVALFDDPLGLARKAAAEGFSHEEALDLIAPGNVWKPYPEGFDPATYHMPPFSVTRWLKDGDTIDLGNRVLEVIWTPGHSPDSVSLLDRKARLLWVGDLFYTGSVYTFLPGGDFDQFLASYRKLIDLFPLYDKIMPSHNEPWLDKEILKDVLAAAEGIRKGKTPFTVGKGGMRKYDFGRFALILGPDQ
jgi:glyoxylase-like metal-dependent hydrolase (beta-lactamase superfamily II)